MRENPFDFVSEDPEKKKSEESEKKPRGKKGST